MGLFARRKSKSQKVPVTNNNHDDDAPTSRKHENGTSRRKSSSRNNNNKEPEEEESLTLEMVPQLVVDLQHCADTSGDKPARALRMLFSLSEHAHDSNNRTAMVNDGELIPVLLEFLYRCDRGSSEQYLALLVINNVCIPSENKRRIAMECGGAKVFSRLLCQDPSCHLMAIVLVNLTFCDAELRKELVRPETDIYIVESLSYALRVSSFSHDEFEARDQQLPTGESPQDLLVALLEEEKRLGLTEYNTDPTNMLYPETARWCLSALKNLTRPWSKDSTAAHALIHCGIVPLMVRLLTFGSDHDVSPTHSTDSSTPHPSDPQDDMPDFTNAPTMWDSNSMQDGALFVVLNLCATTSAREYMQELDTVHILSLIPAYRGDNEEQQSKVLDFQCLKARMAMSYLVGSSGHFGQHRSRSSTNLYTTDPNESVLNITDVEIELLVELLANTLHQRSKEGPGGYSAATFNVKGVLLAVRCLLTHSMNPLRFVNAVGPRLNALLLKALAQHALQGTSNMDAEAAEHACFSMYLLSDHGFQTRFLPAIYGDYDKMSGKGSLTAKVLTSYLHKETITSAGRHAADQLLLRLRYLVFKGSVTELKSSRLGTESFVQSDYAFDDTLMEATEQIIVEKRSHGARPRDEIFDRPILRSRAPKRGIKAPWENQASITVFPNALEAVKELSYGSTKVRHIDAIDDIVIANNIANSANGEKTESYNYWWSWKDAASDITRNLERQTSSAESLFSGIRARSPLSDGCDSEPMSMLGAFRCGSMLCGTDTTTSEK